MAIRGRKRRLELEAEYWRLSQSGQYLSSSQHGNGLESPSFTRGKDVKGSLQVPESQVTGSRCMP